MKSGKRPSLALIIVVLPVPLVPTMAVTEPVGMAKVPCCQMIWSPTLDGGIAEHDAIGSFTHNARLWQTMLTIVLNIVYGW